MGALIIIILASVVVYLANTRVKKLQAERDGLLKKVQEQQHEISSLSIKLADKVRVLPDATDTAI